MFELYIPGRPKAKGRPRVSRTGYVYTPKRTVDEEQRVKAAFREAFPEADPLTGPVEVVLDYMPAGLQLSIRELAEGLPKWRGDLDNLAKLTLDALNGLAYADDHQVVHLDAFKTQDA